MVEWYSPVSIRFTREQMIWLIENLELLEEGIFPCDPKDTGYTETPNVQTSRSHRARFETPAQYCAEVTARMYPKDKNGKIIDRKLHEASDVLVWEVQHGLSDYELLSPQAKRALNYISGWSRRETPFSKWCYQQKEKMETKRTPPEGGIHD